jgi:hypothetical protein
MMDQRVMGPTMDFYPAVSTPSNNRPSRVTRMKIILAPFRLAAPVEFLSASLSAMFLPGGDGRPTPPSTSHFQPFQSSIKF